MFTSVLPDVSPKFRRYSSGWSNDKLFINGIDFTTFDGRMYAKKAVYAFETINSFTLLFMASAIKGKTKTNCRKWTIDHTF